MPSDTRFIVLSNFNSEAVLDRETGVVWQRDAGGPRVDWWTASRTCNGASIGGRKGWRLPTVQELSSVIDPGALSAPRLPAGHPFQNVHATINAQNQIDAYWSSTAFDPPPDPNTGLIDSTPQAWIVSFYNFAIDGIFKFGDSRYTWYRWCVRTGQGVDPL
jgi:hypothetical protein